MKRFHDEINKAFRPLKKMQYLTLILFIAVIFLKFMLLIEIQTTVDSISQKNLDVTMGYLKESILFIVAFFLVNCVFQYFFRNLQYNSHYTLMKNLFRMTLEKEYSFHEEYVPSVTLSMIKDDSKFISDWKSIGVITVIGNVVTMAAAFLILLRYNLLITLFIFLVIVLCFVITHFISKIIGNKTYNLQVSNSEVNQKIVDYLNGIKDVKQYKKENFFHKCLADFIDGNAYKHSNSISKYYSVFTSIYAVLTTALPMLVVLIGVILILNGQFTIGQLIGSYALVGNLQEPVLVIPDFLNQRRQALAMQDKILPILESNSENYSNERLDSLESFSFQSEEYTFGDGKKILENVHFTLDKGEHFVIKGKSGKGKSSLLNLISRFYSTKEQNVHMEYNGIPVETIQPHAYYEHVMQAQQMPYIFRDTVLNNISLGESYGKEELNEVLHVVCLEEFVDTKGIDYQLEQNGENISGGQRQRIGLARVLLRKPDILMLDEPTSALNPELVSMITERIIQYCQRYKMALMIISHNESFEKYYVTSQNIHAEKINV